MSSPRSSTSTQTTTTTTSGQPIIKGLKWIGFLIGLFCPPLATTFPVVRSFINTLIPDHSWSTIITVITLILYEILLIGGLFLGKIWQKLEDNWVSEMASWLDTRLRWLVSHQERKYREYIGYQHRDLDVKGLSTQNVYTLALQQVFVELSIAPTPIHQTSANPLRVPPELSGGTNPIWSYLGSKQLREQNLVIIGAPGSGKTTLLKHIVMILVSKQLRQQSYQGQWRLPVLLFLREHAQAIQNASAEEPYTLPKALVAHARKWWHYELSAMWVQEQLEKGRCLICLDGLDEVADQQQRRQVVVWVEGLMNSHSKNRFLITSRPHGYKKNPLQRVMVLEARPFTLDQITRFVHGWYYANEIMSARQDDKGVELKARNGAEDLLRRLHAAPALMDLAVNPLLLTMIATVHRYRDSLPGKRVSLYSEICEVFLGKRDEARDLPLEISAAQKKQVLQPLACYMMVHGKREITQKEACDIIKAPLAQVHPNYQPLDFLRLVHNTSGIFLEQEQEQYSFAHLTFQEYLAACYIKEIQQEQLLVENVAFSWWHETIRLYSAQADATQIIAACLIGNPPAIAALTLALECRSEAQSIKPEVRARLNDWLEKGIEDRDPERRHLVAEVLLAQRIKGMQHLKDEVYIDIKPVSYAEYQLFLDEMAAQGKFFYPDHWRSTMFPAGKAREAVVGVRWGDAQSFCTWLTKRDALWEYKLPHQWQLEELQKEQNSQLLTSPKIIYWSQFFSDTIQYQKTALDTFFINRQLDNDLTLKSSEFISALKTISRRGSNHSLATYLSIAFSLDQYSKLRDSSFIHLFIDDSLLLDVEHQIGDALKTNLSLTLNHIRKFNYSNIFSNQDRHLTSAQDLDFDVTHWCKEIIEKEFLLKDTSFNINDIILYLYQYLRICTYFLANYFFSLYKEIEHGPRVPDVFPWRRMVQQARETREGLINLVEKYSCIWYALALLEGRVRGNIEASEGILLVKEPMRFFL